MIDTIDVLATKASGLRMRIPEVLIGNTSLGENHAVLSPDAVAAARERGTVRSAVADPDELVVPRFAGTASDLAVPFVREPGAGAVLGGAIGVAIFPGAIPLHDQMVVGVGRVSPNLAIEHVVRAVGRSDEDVGHIVVAELVEPAASCHDWRGRSGDRSHRALRA